MRYKPIVVANSFIERFGTDNNISHMKLQKLVFFANGWQLAVTRKPLVDERSQVWRYGPIFRSLYSRLTGRGNNPIKLPVTIGPFDTVAESIPNNNSDVSNLINWIWDKYGSISAERLSGMTHEPGTPWYTIAKKHNFSVPAHMEIDDDLVEEYFRGVARTEGVPVPGE